VLFCNINQFILADCVTIPETRVSIELAVAYDTGKLRYAIRVK